MKLCWIEKWLINSPVRPFVQKVLEARQLNKMGGPAVNARALEIGLSLIHI